MLKNEFKISLILFFLFLLFYALQIPYYTSKPDVIVFAIRALADKPILDFAYLPQETLLDGTVLPNYHLGHTLVLWLVYQIVPVSYSSTIWISGFISAMSGAGMVVLTFLIWRSLNFNMFKSLSIALVVGLIPSFWEQSVIGEVYALQYFFVLLFILAFIRDKIILAAIFFMYANLISPLSGLAFGLIFLKGFNQKIIKQAFIVGALAVVLYAIVYLSIGANLLDLLSPPNADPEGRGVVYRTLAFISFVIINFNFFLFHLLKGMKFSLKDNTRISITLILATIPQVLLIFAGATFFIELGSFQLPVFWALAFPLGYYLGSVEVNKYYFGFALFAALTISFMFWIRPNMIVGKEREDAGKWLRVNGYNNTCVIGPWSVGVNIIKGRDGSNLNALEKYYIEKSNPEDIDLEKTHKKKLIIASAKKMPFRVALSKINLKGLGIDQYDPIKEIKIGKVTKLFENDAVSLFKWEK
ncbi:MAG: hypothetical protein KDC52_08920 [Ignavibacteriae bacterium]|nr:hypothetical protein [Ignavibacteriota bacterium]